MVGASHSVLALDRDRAQATIKAIRQVAQATGQDSWRAVPIVSSHLEML
jgi:hypothetical protein